MGSESARTYTTLFFFKIFIYIVLFNVAILCTSVILHEGGHYLVGTLLDGCEGVIILYDTQMFGPYTVLECPESVDVSLLYLTGLLLMIPYGLLFLILKEFPERHYFVIILGLSVFGASLDFQALTGSELVFIIRLIGGAVIFLIGEYLLLDRTFNRFEKKLL